MWWPLEEAYLNAGIWLDIQQRVEQYKQRTEATDMDVEIAACHYFNDANLLGAVAHFLNSRAE